MPSLYTGQKVEKGLTQAQIDKKLKAFAKNTTENKENSSNADKALQAENQQLKQQVEALENKIINQDQSEQVSQPEAEDKAAQNAAKNNGKK